MLAHDLRYALRGFLRTPSFTITALVAIALGAGASTAVFSVVDRILFRPLPYPHAEQLVSFGMLAPRMDRDEFLMADAYFRFRESKTPFTGLAAFDFVVDCDVADHNPQRLGCARVDASYLPVFGIQPVLGRNFTPQEDAPGAPGVALLSYGLWESRFGGNREVLGQPVTLDGRPTTIIGVLPEDFEFPALNRFDLLIPAALDRSRDLSMDALRVFGRLSPGISIERARAELAPLFEEERKHIPAEVRRQASLALRPIRERQIEDVKLSSWILFGAVVVMLLIACADVANLMLARAAGRRRELAIRHALGASRARIVRQALTESILLAVAGALLGCGVASALLRFFVAIAPRSIARLQEASLDGRVLLFAAGISIAAGVLFGAAPAFERPSAEALAGGRSVISARGLFRHVLIAGQIAASLVLLASGSLLLRSLWSMERVPLGLNPDHVVTAHFVLSRSYVQNGRVLPFLEDLERGLKGMPGVDAVAVSSTIPPFGGLAALPFAALNLEGKPRLPAGTGGFTAWRYITPGYFAALGIPILRGRDFDESDRRFDSNAIVLSASLARRLFPDSDALGKHIYQTERGLWHTVIGVAADVRNNGLMQQGEPEFYLVRKHVADEAFGNGARWLGPTIIVRSSLDDRAVAAMLRRKIAEIDPALPLAIQTMRERVAQLTERPRFNALLLGGFAAAGVLLAVIGIYGVMAFLVAQRTREFGLRMALGATHSAVVRQILWHAARWTAAGIVMGSAGAWFATRLLASLLFQVPEHDPASLAIPIGMLFVAALAAAWSPARRAARVDPVVSLREE